MPVSTVKRPVSALRQRMLEDMAMRGLRLDTQHDYVRVVRSFAAFLGRLPDTATAEDIRRFQNPLARAGESADVRWIRITADRSVERTGPTSPGACEPGLPD